MLLAGAIALIAMRAHALTRGGALAAFVVGTLTYASGTIAFTLVLLAFFVSSVGLSRLGRARKRELVDVGKAGPRDAWQVLANGGVATICAVAWAFTQELPWAFAFAGAYAVSTADTWATEIGTLARGAPRSILSLRPLPTGMSGGVTLQGTLAEIVGALWIGIVALVALVLAVVGPARDFGWSVAEPWWGLAAWALIVPVGGIAGATIDSVLGAALQEQRQCDACGRPCETNPHACGRPTRLIRGVRGISNDVVNFASTLSGAVVAFAAAALMR